MAYNARNSKNQCELVMHECRKWNILDTIQLIFIEIRIKYKQATKRTNIKVKRLRPRVKRKLVKKGYKVEYCEIPMIGESWSDIRFFHL